MSAALSGSAAPRESGTTGIHDAIRHRPDAYSRPKGTDRQPRAGREGVRLPLLALLVGGPAHGYELKQALENLLGAAYPQPNVGQIYVTLGRLEKAGLIQGEDVEQSDRRN